MLRLTEVALFLSPFLIFGFWWFSATRGFPSQATVAASAAALLLMLGCLLWFSQSRSIPEGETYVPAHVKDGRIVPGHGVR